MHLSLSSSSTPALTTEPRLSSHRERVLLIEPCAVTTDIIKRAFDEHGYAITCFPSGEKALAHLMSPLWFGHATPAESVLRCVDALDVELRVFAEVVRLAGCPLVLFGTVAPESLCGATAFVKKPAAMNELLGNVRQSMSRLRAKEKPRETFYGNPFLAGAFQA